MRIAITSDLHYPITSKGTILELIDRIKLSDSKVVCLAGDIAECRLGTHLFTECVKFFTYAFSNVCVVLGNHDCWDDYGNSQLHFDKILPELCKNAGAHYLENNNYYLDNLTIVGSMLHYDYSAKSKEASIYDDSWFAVNKGKFNNDAYYLKLTKSDIEFATELGNKFVYRLKEADADENVHSIVIVTHDPCFDCQVTRKPEWIYSNAYFGNITYENEIKKINKLKHVVSGHTHCRTKDEIIVDNRTINVETLGSDYYKPEFVIVEV